MPELKADIDYTSDGDDTTFSANTPAGQEYLGGPEITLPSTDAAQFVADGRARGLTIQPFF
jgi:hypothetical protein